MHEPRALDRVLILAARHPNGYAHDGLIERACMRAFCATSDAEPFNLEPDERGRLVIRIRKGTLVFDALDGSGKVAARYVVEDDVGTWCCRTVGQPLRAAPLTSDVGAGAALVRHLPPMSQERPDSR